MVNPITALQSHLEIDLKREMERLEEPKGFIGSRFVTLVQNEFNRFINIFVTREFSTDSQIYVLLDKEVKALSKIMNKIDRKTGEKSEHTNPEVLRENQAVHQSIRELTSTISEMMEKTKKVSGRKDLKELQHLQEDLRALKENNNRELIQDSHLLHMGLNAREKPARAQLEKALQYMGKWVFVEPNIADALGEKNAQLFKEFAAGKHANGSTADMAMNAHMAVALIRAASSVLNQDLYEHIKNACEEATQSADKILDLEEIFGNPTAREESSKRLDGAHKEIQKFSHHYEAALAADKSKKARLELKKKLPLLAQKIVQDKELVGHLSDPNAKFLHALASNRGLSGTSDQIALNAQKTLTILRTASEKSQKAFPKDLQKDCEEMLRLIDAIVLAEDKLGNRGLDEALVKSSREEMKVALEKSAPEPTPAEKGAALAIVLTIKDLQERIKRSRLEIKNDLPVVAKMTLENKELMRFVSDSEAKLLQGVAQSRGFSGNNLQVALRSQEAMEIIKRTLVAKHKVPEGMRALVNKVDPHINILLSSEEQLRKHGLAEEVAVLLREIVPGEMWQEEVFRYPLEIIIQLGNSVIAGFADISKQGEPISEETQKKIEELKGHLEEFKQMGMRRKAAQEAQATDAMRKARKDMGKDLLEPVIKKGVVMQKKAKIMHKAKESKKQLITQEMLTKALLYASQHHGKGLKKTLNTLAKQKAHIKSEAPRIVS